MFQYAGFSFIVKGNADVIIQEEDDLYQGRNDSVYGEDLFWFPLLLFSYSLIYHSESICFLLKCRLIYSVLIAEHGFSSSTKSSPRKRMPPPAGRRKKDSSPADDPFSFNSSTAPPMDAQTSPPDAMPSDDDIEVETVRSGL